jgi:energy-coupling factor transport system permease protein
MQWVASGFLFVRGSSFIHRMDPRVRLSIAITLFVVGILARSITELSILILLSFVLSFLSQIMKRFMKSLAIVGAFGLVVFLVTVLVSHYSVNAGIINALRLFEVIQATSIFFLTTTPDELEQVMKWLHLPTDFIMIFVIAVRFVPVLLIDAFQIMDAQRSRGLEFDKGGLIQRIRNTIPLLVPLIAVAVTRSLDLAEAMDARAYGALKKPSSMYKLSMQPKDYAGLAIALSGGAIGLFASFFINLI